MAYRRRRRGRARLLAFLVLVATFFAGALTGVTYERLGGGGHDGKKHRRAAALFDPNGPLGERLELSAEQRRRIEAILTEHRAQAETIFGQFRPRLESVFDATADAVRQVLAPEQRAEFEKYLRERRDKFKKRLDRPRGEPEGERERSGTETP